MNSEEQEMHQRGDSDDEIAELRFQALLTKKENEAEVSPSRGPHPYNDASSQMSMNQPLSNYRGGHHYNYRGRGRGSQFYKPYLQTFSQQIASNSVNSNNIVVLTSSDTDDQKQPYPSDWNQRRGFRGRGGGGWPGRGGDRGFRHPTNGPPMLRTEQPPPPLVLPQDKYAPPAQTTQEQSENKTKLSARMRRLQGSDSDSEDSESDSSDDSSSDDSSSDSNTSSSDSSSSGSDSESENSQAPSSKKGDKEKVLLKKEKSKPKNEVSKHPPANSIESKSESTGEAAHGNAPPSSRPKSPVKSTGSSKQPPSNSLPSGGPTESKKGVHSPPFRKESSRSPSLYSSRRRSSPHSARYHSRSPLTKRRSSLSPRSPGYTRRPRSSSLSPRRFSRSPPPLRRSRTPVRRYGIRSPYRQPRRSNTPGRIIHSPLGRLGGSKSPRSVPKKYSQSPPSRYRSRSPTLPRRPRTPRSPPPRRTLSPPLRRGSRSPLPPRRLSRSPLRLRSRSPLPPLKRFTSRSPRPHKRYSSITPPPAGRSYNSRSPYGGRKYASPTPPRAYVRKKSRSLTPRRYRSISPRGAASPLSKDYRSRSPKLRGVVSPIRRKSSFSPPVIRYGSRSPLGRSRGLPRSKRSPLPERGRSPGGFSSPPPPHHFKRVGSPHSPRRFSGPDSSVLPPRERSPYPPRSPLPISRYGTPPPIRRGISPGGIPGPKLLPDSLEFKQEPGRLRSPPSHNYASRSPLPYFRGRRSPIGPSNFPPERGVKSQSPPYYGNRAEPFPPRPNRANLPCDEDPALLGKRYPPPNEQPWMAHKAEVYSPYKQPPPSHYPPKFSGVEMNYGGRTNYPPPQAPPQPPPEKTWLGPPGQPSRPFDTFGPPPHINERGHPRLERYPEGNQHPPPLGPRGRGFRGQRGPPHRGVHSRLGTRVPWSGPPQGPPQGLHEPPPYGDPYLREKFPPRGQHLPLPLEGPDPGYNDRKPPPLFDSGPPKSLLGPYPHAMKTGSPPLGPPTQRIPRGPKTPPYSPPKRDPSPMDWHKKDRNVEHDRTPSLSPAHRYDSEGQHLRPLIPLNRGPPPPRERGGSQKRYGIQETRGEPHPGGKLLSHHHDPHVNQYRKDEGPPPLNDVRRSRSTHRESDDKKRPGLRNEVDRYPRDKDGPRKHLLEDSVKHPERDDRMPKRERDSRKEDDRRRSPAYRPRPKAPNGDSRTQLDRREGSRGRERRDRDVDGDQKERRERERERPRDSKRMREKENEGGQQKGMRDNEGKRDTENDGEQQQQQQQKKRREIESDERGGKREREGDSDQRGKRETKGRYEESENFDRKDKEKYPRKSDSRRDERDDDDKRRSLKEEAPSKVKNVEEKKDPEIAKKRDTEPASTKDDYEDKKKKKKKHKDVEKKSSKRKKKEKKKKKDSKKKRKSHKGSDTEELTPKRKKKNDEQSSTASGREGGDLRHMLTKRGDRGGAGGGSPMRDSGGLRRRKAPSLADERREEAAKRRRRDDNAPPDEKDWRGRQRGPPNDRDGARRKEGRPPFQRDREHLDDAPGSKGLLVTVGSGANRHVTSGNSSVKGKGGLQKESLRPSVYTRLGPGNGDSGPPVEGSGSGSKGPKKGGTRLPESSSSNSGGAGRRKGGGGGGGGGGPRRHQGPKGTSKGPTR